MLTQMKVKSVQIQENSPLDLTATPCEYASLEEILNHSLLQVSYVSLLVIIIKG